MTLAEKIDRLGRLRDRIHALETEEKALAGDVRKALAARPGKRADGAKYSAQLYSAPRTVVEDLPALRKAAGRRFLRVVRADVKAARELLGEDVLRRIGRRLPRKQLKVFRKAPATGPRRRPK